MLRLIHEVMLVYVLSYYGLFSDISASIRILQMEAVHSAFNSCLLNLFDRGESLSYLTL